MPSKPIFISHAMANKELANKLVDLMETGVGIPDSDIFCSSLEGIGIPSGTNFVEFIRQQIKEPKVVILLLTSDYFRSQFCLSELGASWVLSHKIIPLLVKPLDYKDVSAVLTGTQLLKIDDKGALNKMQIELIETLGIKGKSFAKWEIKRDEFLEGLDSYIASIETPKSISSEEYDELIEKYDGAIEELKNNEGELRCKDEIIKKLKEAKDSKEVSKILQESLSEIEEFNALVKNAKEALKKVPDIVKEALFHYFRNEVLEWPGFGEDYKREQMRNAVEEDYFSEAEGGLELVEEDPKTSAAIDKLKNLAAFIENVERESEEFCKYYSEEYDHRLNFTSRRFWGTHLL